MNPFLLGILISFVICFLTVFLLPTSIPYSIRKKLKSKSNRGRFFDRPENGDGDYTKSLDYYESGHGLWVGLMLSTFCLSIFQQTYDQVAGAKVFGFGPSLLWLIVLSIPLWTLSLRSDFFKPKSEYHMIGLIISGILMWFLGFHIFILTNPLTGTTALSPLISIVLTVIWLVLFTSILEVVSLIRYGVTILILILSLTVIIGGGLEHSVASNILAGMLPGVVLGRFLALRLTSKRVYYGKAEIFLLGLWATAMLNVSFLKSVALVGVVLPVGAFTVIVIILMIRAFERTLILRETPR